MKNKVYNFFSNNKESILIGITTLSICTFIISLLFTIVLCSMTTDLVNVVQTQNKEITQLTQEQEAYKSEALYNRQAYENLYAEYYELIEMLQEEG